MMHCISSYFFFLCKIFFPTETFSGVELFPTHLRSTAMAVTLVAARLGAILGNTVFGLFLEVQCAVPIIMVAALLVGQQQLATLSRPSHFILFQRVDCWDSCCPTPRSRRWNRLPPLH